MSEFPDDDAPDVRAFLHDMSGRIHARDDLFDRVRAGAQRRRRFRVSATTVAAVAIVGCGAGLATVGNSTAPPVGVAGSGVGAVCPALLPDQASLPAGHPGVSETLVPGNPVSGIACVFESDQPADASVPTVTMLQSTALTGSELTSVVAALQHPVSLYSFRCPYAPRRDTLYLEFGYASGVDVAVEVTSPCPGLTNGSLTGAFNANGILPAVIEALLPQAAQ